MPEFAYLKAIAGGKCAVQIKGWKSNTSFVQHKDTNN